MREPAVVRKYPNRTDPIFVAPTEAGGILPLLRLSSQGHLDLDVVQNAGPFAGAGWTQSLVGQLCSSVPGYRSYREER